MTTITALPPAPSRSDPDTFSSKSDALLGALDTFVTETNTVAGEVVAAADAAAASASDAADQVVLAAAQVTLAEAQVSLATAQADAAEGSALVAGAVVWVSGTTYAIGDCRYSPINLQTYRRRTNGAGTTDPSADSTNWAKAIELGVNNVVTATGMTTLTSTATLLQITPASYGVAVTLPDATTCNIGGPLHIIDNKGAYPVRVLNNSGTLLGFIFAGVVSHISLIDKSTAAGVWTIENNELVGASAQLLTTNMAVIDAVIDIGSSQEVIIGRGVSSANCYGVVYNRSTNTFGSVTLIRTATLGSSLVTACLSGANQVLVCSVATNTAFEAVVLSVSGTTITVGTAATATLSANVNPGFVDGCGLIAVGSSFVCSYTVATPAAQIRALSVSGTTVTIGSAEVLDGTAGGLIAASSDKVIAVSTTTTHLYTKPYTVSGSTLSAGTGTDTNNGIMTLNKFFALGTRWVALFNDGGSTVRGAVVSLSGTTTTVSIDGVNNLFAAGTLKDAIVVGTNKVLTLNIQTTNNANILTDTAGTASAGTAITLSNEGARTCLYVSGTDAYVTDYNTATWIHKVDCSGVSPVLTRGNKVSNSSNPTMVIQPSNAVLSRSVSCAWGTAFAHTLLTNINYTSNSYSLRVSAGEVEHIPPRMSMYGTTIYRGKSDSERWAADGATVITKLECTP